MKKRAFTLVEIMIVILIIGLLLAIAIPQFLNARARSQGTTCIANLREIDAAKEIWAQENNKANGTAVVIGDIWPTYIKASTKPDCPAGGTYTIGAVGTNPTCSYVDPKTPHTIP